MKKLKLAVVSIILLAIVGINISYAMAIPNSSDFFNVNSKESSPGKTLEMTIDLSKIEYNQFEFILSSNVEIEKIYANEDISNNDDFELNKDGNEVVIDINKEKLNLNKIVLYYQIPDSIEVGTKIKLNAQVVISEDEENKVVDEKETEITIVEKGKEESKNEESTGKESQEMQAGQIDNKTIENQMQNMQGTNEKMSNQISVTASNMSNASGNTSEMVTETATYNGSNNNYLSSLEIDGVELTVDFNKEKTTYFATVEDLETITVNAIAEDSNSKVAITGTDLKSGENKVLISVTAENGNVRYYRIYVTNS